MPVLIRYEIGERKGGVVKVKLWIAAARAWRRFAHIGTVKLTDAQLSEIRAGRFTVSETDAKEVRYNVPLLWLDRP